MKIATATALVWSCLVVACGADPKAASEKNFEAAIQKFMDRQGPECYFRHEFPVSHTTFGEQDVVYRHMSALQAAGLVQIRELDVKEFPDPLGGPKAKLKQRKLEVQLTDEGKKVYVPKQSGSMEQEMRSGGFCFGKQKIVKVGPYTEPADAIGMKVSQVNYTYRYDEIPAWAKHEAIGELFPQITKVVASEKEPIQGRAAVVLTNQGWIHERDMNRAR